MEKKSFVMYADYQKHIARLSDGDAGKLMKAIFAYVNGSDEVQLSPAADMAFSFIKERIDHDTEKWNAICQKRSEAGKKSGESRRSKQTRTKRTSVPFVEQKQANGNKDKQTRTKRTENDNDNIEQTSTAPGGSALPAPGEEAVIPWDEIDFELV
ncbi:MAG: DUF6291 domain-containing protein [Ruminococcus sp.]